MRKLDKYDIETDVIVIGSGFAGLSAAIEAKNAGANVIVFEKMKAVGGNSIISDGGIAAPATELQQEHAINDSKALMYQDIMASGLNINNKELVNILVDQSKAAFDWSIHYLKVPYLKRVDQFGGHSVARCYTAKNITGATIIKKQMEKIRALAIPIYKQMLFKKFILDSYGKVCGGIFREGYEYQDADKGKDIYVKASKGVVIATGGFSSDAEFRKKYDGRLTKDIDTTNKLFTTAEAMTEAMKIGADTVDLNYIQLGPWASPDEKGYGVAPIFAEYIVFQYGMIIDPETGKRFVNELANRKVLADELLLIGHPCIGIADAAAVKYSGWDIERCLKNGVVIAFDCIEELAKYYHIQEEAIKKTIQCFNEGIAQGVDSCFGKPLIEGARNFAKPPFYAVRLWPKVHHTMGGLKINAECEVIDIAGKAIAGLLAAGEVTGGIHGANRLGSCAISECLVFGRIAGKNISK